MRIEPHREPNTTELITYFRQSQGKRIVGQKRTSIKASLQFLSDRHQLNSRPEIWSINLWYSESPTSAIYVPPVLPYWLEPLLEQVNRFSHFDLVNRCIIVVAPEVLNRFNLGTKLL